MFWQLPWLDEEPLPHCGQWLRASVISEGESSGSASCPDLEGDLLSLAEQGRRDGEGASQGKMVPQAAAEPASRVLPRRVSKYPTRLTHWLPAPCLPRPLPLPASPCLSPPIPPLPSHSPPAARRCLSGRPLAVAPLPWGARRHPRLPGCSPPSLRAPLPVEAALSHPCEARAGCRSPAASPEHPPRWHPWPEAWGKRLPEEPMPPMSPTHGPALPWGGQGDPLERCPLSQGGQQRPELTDSAAETRACEHLSLEALGSPFPSFACTA